MRHSAASPNAKNLFDESRTRLKPANSKPQLQHQDPLGSKAITRSSMSSERPHFQANQPLSGQTLKMDSQSTSSLAKRLLDHQNRMRLLSPGRAAGGAIASAAITINNKNTTPSNTNLHHHSQNNHYKNTTNAIDDMITDDTGDSSDIFNPFNNSIGAAGQHRPQQHQHTIEQFRLAGIQSTNNNNSNSNGELARKKIQYFTASAKNFITSSNKLKRFLEPNRQSDVQYALNLFSIDRDNMEKSLRHLEQEYEYLTSFQSGSTSASGNQLLPNNQSSDAIYARLVESLREENAELKSRMDDYCGTSELQETCERLQRQLEKSLRKCTERKNCIKKLYNLVEDKEKEVDEYQATIDQLQSELHAKQLHIQELEDSLHSLGKENTNLHTQRHEKRESIDELRQSIMEVQSRLKIGGCRDDVLGSQSDRLSLLARWKCVRDFLLDRYKISNLQREESESECDRLREELRKHADIIAEFEHRISESAQLLKQSEVQRQGFEEAMYVKSQVETRLEESNSHSTNLVRKLQTEVRRWQDEANSLTQQLQETKQRFENDRIEIGSSFERKFYELQQTWEQRIEQCSEEWVTEAESKDAIAAAKQREIESLQRQLSHFERRRVDMVSTFEAEKAGSTRAVEESQEIAGEQKRRILTLTEDLTVVRQQLKANCMSLADRNDELALKNNELQLVQSELTQARESIVTTKARLNASIDEVVALKREIATLQERAKIADFKSETLSRDVNKLSDELANLSALKIELTLQLESSQGAAKKSLEKLKQIVVDLTADVKGKELALEAAAKDAADASDTIQAMKLDALRVQHRFSQLEQECAASDSKLKECMQGSDENKRVCLQLKAEKNASEEMHKKRSAAQTEDLKKYMHSIGELEKRVSDERGAREDVERNVSRLEEIVLEKEKLIALNESTYGREVAWRDARIDDTVKALRRVEVDLLNANVTLDRLKKDVMVSESRSSALASMNAELENIIAEKNGANGLEGSSNGTGQGEDVVVSESRKRFELVALLASKDDEILQLKSTLLESETGLGMHVKALEDKCREFEYASAQVVELNAKKLQVDEENDALNHGLLESDGKCRKAEAALAMVKAESKRVHSQLESMAKLAEELRSENLELKHVNEELCERNANVARDFERVSDQLGQFSASNAKYEANLSKLIDAKERLDDQLLILSNERLEAEHRLNLSNAQVDKLAERLSNQSKEFEAVKLSRIDLQEELALQVDRQEQAGQESVIKLAKLTAENDRLTKTVKGLKEENAMLKKSIDGIFAQSETQRAEQSELYSTELSELNASVLELKKDLKKAQDDRSELSVRFDATSKRNDRLTLERDSLQIEAAKSREAKQTINEELLDAKAKVSGLLEKERIQREELESLHATLHGYQLKCEGLNKDVEVGNSSRKTAEQKAGATEAAMKTQVSVLAAESAEFQRQVNALSRELDRVSAELETALRNWQASRVEADRLNSELEKCCELYQHVQVESQTLSEEVQAQSSRAHQLDELLSDRDARIDELTQLVQESHEQMNLQASRAQEFYAVNAELQATIESLDEQQAELQQEKQALELERDSLVQARDECEEDIRQLQADKEELGLRLIETSRESEQAMHALKLTLDTDRENAVKNERECRLEEHAAIIQEKDGLIRESQQEIEQASQSIEQLQLQINDQKKAIEELNDQLKDREGLIEDLRAQLVVLSESNTALLAQAGARSRATSNLQNKAEHGDDDSNNCSNMFEDFGQFPTAKVHSQRNNLQSQQQQFGEFPQDDHDGGDAGRNNRFSRSRNDESEFLQLDEFQDDMNFNSSNPSRAAIARQQHRSPGLSQLSSRSVSPSQITIIPAEDGAKPIEIQFSNNRIPSRSNLNLSQHAIDLNTSFGQAQPNESRLRSRSLLSSASPVTAAQILSSNEIPADKTAVAELIADLQNKSQANFNEQLEEAEAEIESLKISLASAETELQSMHIQHAQIQEELAELQHEHADSLGKFDAVKTDLLNQLASSHELIETTKKQLNDLKLKFNAMCDTHEQEILASDTQLNSLKEQLRSTQRNAIELQEQYELKSREFEDSRAESHELLEQLQNDFESTKAKQNDLLRQKQESNAQDVNGLRNSLAEKQRDIDRQILDKQRLQDEIAVLTDDIAALQGQLERERAQSKATLAEYVDCVASLQRELTNEKEAAAAKKEDLQLVQLAQQDLQIKMEVIEIKTKSYFNMLMKILLAFDSDLDDKVSQTTHSFEQLLSVGITLAKAAFKLNLSKQQQSLSPEDSENLSSMSILQQQEAAYANHLEALLMRVLHREPHQQQQQQQQLQSGGNSDQPDFVFDSDSLSAEHRAKVLALVEQVNAFNQMEANALNDFTF